MAVYFFTKGDIRTASSRQRAFKIVEHLQKDGIDACVCTPPIDEISQTAWPKKATLLLAALRNLFHAGSEDTIVVQRAIGNKYFFGILLVVLLVFRRRVIFDFDDAIFVHSPWKTRFVVRHASVVITGSHALADWARKYAKHDVYYIPTCVEYELYAPASLSQRGPSVFTIGWIGNGPAHKENLALLVPVLTRLVNEHLDFRFVLIGALHDAETREMFSAIPGLSFECVDDLAWDDPNAVPMAIHSFSVGVMPLVDSIWSQNKCAFKAIEYMAAGVPAVVSAVGENTVLISDGVNGFTAAHTDEWVSKIVALYNDPALHARIGLTGARHIKEHYSFVSWHTTYRDILEGR